MLASSDVGFANGTCSGNQYCAMRTRAAAQPCGLASTVSVWPGGNLRTARKNVRVSLHRVLPRWVATMVSSSASGMAAFASTASTALAKANWPFSCA